MSEIADAALPSVAAASRPAEIAPAVADTLLLASFFLSGASALTYQVAWQRALYAQLGVDIDSITIIVSVFMLGIGLGGMAGGWLADRVPARRLWLYAGVECSIGLYGLASLHLLPLAVGAFAPAAATGSFGTAAACFVFLLVPTVLMGITLPLLTIAFDERRANIGVSVGTLYFTNTMGAALGAALVPLQLLPRFTLPQVVVIAAVGNFVVIACAFLSLLATRRRA